MKPVRPLALLALLAAVAAYDALPVRFAAAQTPAQPPMSSASACPAGNLLAGKSAWSWQDMRGRLEQATDGIKAPEGAIWDAPLAVILDTGAATVTWDLGATHPLAVAWIQADANDTYTLWGSTDGQTFSELGHIDPVAGHGLRGRSVSLGDKPVRYLKFGEGEGDSSYSLSEIQVFCQMPQPFPPAMTVGTAQAAPTTRTILTYWNDESSARWELVLAVLGLGLLQWGLTLQRQGRPEFRRPLRLRLLKILGVLGALTFINFGFFHFGNFIHTHEWVHYYVGSKYFPELSYTRLYDCLSVADVEDGLRRRVERRRTTNLTTNVLEPSTGIVANPERCKAHFSEPRWQAFRKDVSFFRARLGARTWDDIQLDHGYNATPLWNALGTTLANLSPASNTQLYALAMLDPLYLAATIAVVYWAFGWRVLAVALLAFATNFPSRFYWTGGSFLRWDWLFYTIAAICCLRKQRPALAGAALAYATGLRVFPVFLFAGPAIGLVWHLYQGRRAKAAAASPAPAPASDPPPPRWDYGASGAAFTRSGAVRFFVSAALVGSLLVGVSLAVSGGTRAYQEFAANTTKHKETPLVNNLGLRTVVSWRPAEVGRFTNDSRLIDPWSPWKQARLDSWKEARPLALLIALGWLVMIGLCARHVDLWVAAALGITFVPVAVELTSYYYAFILGIALLAEQREQVGRWLLLLTGFTQFVAWAPLKGMSRWGDEQYTLMAAATLATFGAIVWIFRRPGEKTGVTSDPAWVESSSPATAPGPEKKKRSRR